MFQGYGTADMERLLRDQKELYGDRKFRGLILATPSALFNERPDLRLEMNAWMNEELYKAPDCVGTIYVMPNDTVEDIKSMLTNPQIRGFKCYHQSAKTDGPTWLAEVWQYLPESAWQVADKHGLCITVHLVKDAALSDPDNLAHIKEMTAKYPNAKLILAHCARGFAAWTVIEAARKLNGIDNIYYDTAAVCESSAIFEVIRQAGADHVMWGTDYPIDRSYGKPITCGTKLHWMYKRNMVNPDACPVALVVVESLFAMYQACLMLDATKEDVENIFYNNAVKLFQCDEL
jgi:glutamate-1-semialdehyde 2,1-aminomutase